MAGGCFVTKVFRSKDYNKLIWVFNQFFAKVEATKPASSRNVSAEIFVVCREYKAPKKIDPRLLDPKYVFKEVDDVPDEELDEKKMKERQGALLNDLFHPEKRRRHRTGYADGDYTLHISNSITDFVQGPDFLGVLTRSNNLRFDADEFGKSLAEHPITTEEIKQCCEDLKVLGKKDFKDLLKWREAIRLDLGLDEKKKKEADSSETKVEEGEEDEDEETLATKLGAESKAAALRLKREKRKARERKAKLLLKLRLGMGTPDEIGLEASDAGGLGTMDGDDQGLFRLNGVDAVKKAKPVSMTDAPDLMLSSDDEDDGEEQDSEDDTSMYDSDEEVERKVGQLEQELDGLYEQFKEKRLERDAHARVRHQKEGAKAFEEWYGVEYEKKRKREAKDIDGAHSEDSSDDSEGSSDEEGDHMIAAGSKRKSRGEQDGQDEDEDSSRGLSKRAKVFFDNPLFKSSQANGKAAKDNEKKQQGGLFAQEMSGSWSDDSSDDDVIPTQKKNKKAKTEFSADDNASDAEGHGFEVVPQGSEENGGINGKHNLFPYAKLQSY